VLKRRWRFPVVAREKDCREEFGILKEVDTYDELLERFEWHIPER
jgi:hypothetical protein